MLIIIHVHFQLQSLEFVNKRVVDYDHVCCEHVVCEHVCCVQVCFDDSQVLIITHVHFQLQSVWNLQKNLKNRSAEATLYIGRVAFLISSCIMENFPWNMPVYVHAY